MRVEAPVVAEQPRAYAQGLAVGVIHAVCARHLGVCLVRRRVGKHVYAGAEGPGAVYACACAALYLYVAQRRCQVGHIDPVDIVALGVVDRYAVGSDVDSRPVGATHAHRRVAYAGTGIRGRDDRRRHAQQVGYVAPVVVVFELCLGDVGKCHGGFVCGAVGHDLDLSQHHGGVAVGLRVGSHAGPGCKGSRAYGKKFFLHCKFFSTPGLTVSGSKGIISALTKGQWAPLNM